MIGEIELHLDELRALCRRFHVQRLDLFGSTARGDFDPEHSDIDLQVESDCEHPEAFNAYFDFKEVLQALLGCLADLAEPGAVRNPYLEASTDASREPIFEA